MYIFFLCGKREYDVAVTSSKQFAGVYGAFLYICQNLNRRTVSTEFSHSLFHFVNISLKFSTHNLLVFFFFESFIFLFGMIFF